MIPRPKKTDLVWMLLGVALALLLVALPIKIYMDLRLSSVEAQALEQYRGLDSTIKQERHKTESLSKVLSEAKAENEELIRVIAELKQRPEKIRTIVKTVTKIEGRTETVEVMPPDYRFRTKQGLAVASFESQPLPSFTTYDLEFQSIYVIGDGTTSYKLKVRSSFEPDNWISLDQELEIVDIRSFKHKILKPGLAMGVSLNVPRFEPGFALMFTWLHPTKSIDLLSVRAQPFTTPSLGLDAIGYRVSDHIPFFEDLWISVGASISIKGDWSGDLTISTRL